MKFLIWVCLLWCGVAGVAQTVTPDETSILVARPKKIGMNLNGPTYYQGGEIYKNLLWRNPGFEPDLYRDKFVAFRAGTTTTFPSPNQYDPVIANFWAGASFKLYRGAAAAAICSGTIAGNSVAANGLGPVYTFSAPCASAVEEADVILLRQAIVCTAENVWEGQGGGWWGEVAGGGRLVSECAAPYDGVQSLRMDASVGGSAARVKGYVDTNATDVGILISGQYAVSGMYRTVGNAQLQVSGQRLVSGATGNPFSCAVQTFGAATSWTRFTANCPGSETAAVGFGPIVLTLEAVGGVVVLDNVSFQKTAGTDATNTTVFRDELLTTLRAHCAGSNLAYVPCELRDWAFQNADEIDNTVKPIFERRPTLAGLSYDYPPNGAVGSMSVGLEEFLELCEAIQAEPYYVMPETTNPEEAGGWIEYLNGAASTPYGARRVANGQAASWLSVFPTVHLPMGNENWNEGATGQGLGFRADAQDYYFDYSQDAARVWSVLRGDASWPAGGAGVDLVLGFQDGAVNYGVAEAMARANPDSAELAPYTQAYVGDVAPLTALWDPLLYEVVANTTNPATVFYQQGNAVKAHGKLNVYEFDNGTSGGGAGLTQQVLDSFTDAAGYGTATALQALQMLAFGVVDQNFFSLDQYAFYIPNVGYVHNWGAVIDMGGATNAVRPQELGMRMANAAIIGPMYSCQVTNPTTYDLAPNHNGPDSGGIVATKGIAQEYAFCFRSGLGRSMIAINTDVTTAHGLAFGGAQAPAGEVTVTRYAPASISTTNEATANNPTMGAVQHVSISAPFTLQDPLGDLLPPYSITRYDWVTADRPLISTDIEVSGSSADPVAGLPFTVSVSLSSTIANGTVVFADRGTVLATLRSVDGLAAIVIPALAAGTHSFTVRYGGNKLYASGISAALVVDARVATQLGLVVSDVAPVGGTSVTLTATLSTASSSAVTFMDGAAVLGAVNMVGGSATFTVSAIAPGAHAFTAVFGGDAMLQGSASGVVAVVASDVPVAVSLVASGTSASVGSIVELTASLSAAGAGGSITFLDGGVTVATMPVQAGGASYLVAGITAGVHRYTASYSGAAGYTGGSSAVMMVTGLASVPYLQTSFTERAAGTALAGTRPAQDRVGAVWEDRNGDWTFASGGGVVADTADLSNPLLIDTGQTDYTAIFALPATGARLLFRVTDLANNLMVVTYDAEIDLYAVVGGVATKLAVLYAASAAGQVTITLRGTMAGIAFGGQAAAGVIPQSLAGGTMVGVLPGSAGFKILGLAVVP